MIAICTNSVFYFCERHFFHRKWVHQELDKQIKLTHRQKRTQFNTIWAKCNLAFRLSNILPFRKKRYKKCSFILTFLRKLQEHIYICRTIFHLKNEYNEAKVIRIEYLIYTFLQNEFAAQTYFSGTFKRSLLNKNSFQWWILIQNLCDFSGNNKIFGILLENRSKAVLVKA